MTDSIESTDCYGCRGANQRSECGFLEFGCLLCQTYGDGQGKLRVEYRQKEVKIGNETFTPPEYVCLYCKDTHVYEYQVYVESLRDESWSDGGLHNMPLIKVACHACCEQEHNLEYEQAKAEILSKY